MRSTVTTQRTRDADIHAVAYSDRLVRLVQLPSEMLTSLTRRASHSPASQETAFPRSLDTWHLGRCSQWEALLEDGRLSGRSQGISPSLALPWAESLAAVVPPSGKPSPSRSQLPSGATVVILP